MSGALLAACSSGGTKATADGGEVGTGGNVDTGPGGDVDCDFTGTWAIAIDAKLSWQGTPTVNAAHGVDFRQWFRIRRTQTRNENGGVTLNDTFSMCGVVFPDLEENSTLPGKETYGLRFPDALFDSEQLPPIGTTGSLDGARSGARYTGNRIAVLFGVTLSDAANATWPSSSSSVTAVDSDQDGKPGVTVTTQKGAVPDSNPPRSYNDPPVDPTNQNRADRIYIAARQVIELAGKVAACDKLTGEVRIPAIGGLTAINQHILGCHIDNNSGECSQVQTAFVENLSNFNPTLDTGAFVMTRVPDGTACADIRGNFTADATAK